MESRPNRPSVDSRRASYDVDDDDDAEEEEEEEEQVPLTRSAVLKALIEDLGPDVDLSPQDDDDVVEVDEEEDDDDYDDEDDEEEEEDAGPKPPVVDYR